MRNNRRELYFLLFAAILVFICYTYYDGVWHRMPYGIHDWAQSDRLSLAIGFYDSGMNFFLPRTYNQMSIDGIAGVEFPVQSYLAACLGHVFGRSSISICFRFLDTIITCIGLLFLYKTVFKITKNFILSVFTPVFIFCSPVFVAYTCSYMPDTASVAISFIGFYFFSEYLQSGRNRALLLSIAWLGLATLIKTSAGVYLVGISACGAYNYIRKKDAYSLKDKGWFVVVSLIVYGAIMGYYFYNQYLNQKYQSMLFLAKAQPFENLEAFSRYINVEFKNLWIKEYFTFPQYVIMITLLVTLLPAAFKDGQLRSYVRMFFVFLAGSLCMFYLMGNQLLVHDYYIMVIFFPSIVFGMITAILYLAKLMQEKSNRRMMNTALLTCTVMSFFFADYQAYRRLRTDYKPFSDWARTGWMEGGAAKLQKLHIPATEKIVVFDENAPNLGLCYFDRRGWMIPHDAWKEIKDMEQFLKEKQATVVVFDSRTLDEKQSADSTAFKDFDILSKDNAAILKLKK